MNAWAAANRHRPADDGGKIGGGHQAAAVAGPHDPPGNPARTPLLAVLEDHIRQGVGCDLVEELGERPTLGPVHAHVERGGPAKAEPAALGLDLDRGMPEVGEGAIDLLDAELVEHLVDTSIVGVHEIHAVSPGRQPLTSQRQHLGVPVEPEHPCRAGLEQRLGVSAGPDGAVDEHSSSRRRELLNCLRPQDWLV